MPVKSCSSGGKPGFKFGDAGKCYTYTAGDDDSRKRARQKAVNQGIAMGEIDTSKSDQQSRAAQAFEIVKQLGQLVMPDDTSSTELSKALYARRRELGYYTVQGNDAVRLGFDLPDDVTSEQHDQVGTYKMLVIRSNDSGGSLSVEDAGDSESDANERAIKLIQNNRNKVSFVHVCVGVPYTFANAPVFQQLSYYYQVSKEDHTEKGNSDGKDEELTLSDSIPFEYRCEFMKAQRSLDEGLVYGVVYEPNTPDTDDEYATPDDIRKACHKFLPRAMLNVHHDENGDLVKNEAWPVESYIAPCDFEYVAGDPQTLIKKGSWVLVTYVDSDDLRKDIASGEITGFSMEGTAKRVQ